MTTHTPGPWKATDQGVGVRGKSLGIVIGDARGFPMFFMPRGTAQHEANARLVANAPWMLNSLKLIRGMLEDGTPQSEIHKMADAAIAKAEGA